MATVTKFNAEYRGQSNDDGWQHSEWKVTLKFDNGRQLTTPFNTGMAISKPTVDDVMESLQLDADAGRMDFEEFCSEFGYDSDSRKAEKMWHQCQATAKKMERINE